MKNLFKKLFSLWVRVQWLKSIERHTRKKDRHFAAAKRQENIVAELEKEYSKKYCEGAADEQAD